MLHRNFTPFPVLITERLKLRQLVISDAPGIFALRSSSDVNRYLDRKPAINIDDANNFIIAVNGNVANNNALYWAIIFREQNTIIGTICLFGFSDEHAVCEIGYELLPGFQGNGMMQEALLKVFDYTFNTIGANVIEAFVHAGNQRSLKLLKRCSFKEFAYGTGYHEIVGFRLLNTTATAE